MVVEPTIVTAYSSEVIKDWTYKDKDKEKGQRLQVACYE